MKREKRIFFTVAGSWRVKGSRQMLQASSVSSSSSKAEEEEEEAMAGLKGGDFSDKLKAEA